MNKLNYSITFMLFSTVLVMSCSKQDSKPIVDADSLHQTKSEIAKVTSPLLPVYDVMMETTPMSPSAKKPIIISFTPCSDSLGVKNDSIELTDKTGLFTTIVNSDLTFFWQRAASSRKKGRKYEISMLPPMGGMYTVFTEYAPKGSNLVVNNKNFSVQGDTTPTPTQINKDEWTSTVDNYTIELQPTVGRFISNVLIMVDGRIVKGDQPISDEMLGDIMGDKSQLFLIGQETKEYLHLIPEFSDVGFMFHVFFPKPDTYRAWFQVNIGNAIKTFTLSIIVSQGSKEEIQRITDEHSKYHSNTKQHNHK